MSHRSVLPFASVPAAPRRAAAATLLAGALALAGCTSTAGPNAATAAAPVASAAPAASAAAAPSGACNPIFRNRFTADPAPLAVGDRLYVYAGHDEGDEGFRIDEWVAYSTSDMRDWTDHGAILKPTDFAWAEGEAWAAEMVEKDGKYYFYVTVEHDDSHPGKAIGVAVSDSPTGPFVDARGSALVRDNPETWRAWSDIDPTVLIDDDGTPWMAWGNSNLYLAKLKPNMIELDGPPRELHLTNFLEGPWLHKRGDLYYMTYASFVEGEQTAEHISYATAPSMEGPWTYRGELTGAAQNSFTIHAGIEEFKGNWYFFYHDGTLTIDGVPGSEFRRAVAVEPLRYDADGRMLPIRQTRQGISPTPCG
ncbi:family 43 glycosylhydrolase [Sphingosinithalassobacter sp. LHW66-3]|uniref:family 43 glycosylhydrolase n=1 Tax=Sphingosinithalassobacter sp. LHW66-3 TaxID=3424718 RepID=UPI003D6B3049